LQIVISINPQNRPKILAELKQNIFTTIHEKSILSKILTNSLQYTELNLLLRNVLLRLRRTAGGHP
jgi:hypothetical protein